jgi:hypothetical protein
LLPTVTVDQVENVLIPVALSSMHLWPLLFLCARQHHHQYFASF